MTVTSTTRHPVGTEDVADGRPARTGMARRTHAGLSHSSMLASPGTSIANVRLPTPARVFDGSLPAIRRLARRPSRTDIVLTKRAWHCSN